MSARHTEHDGGDLRGYLGKPYLDHPTVKRAPYPLHYPVRLHPVNQKADCRWGYFQSGRKFSDRSRAPFRQVND